MHAGYSERREMMSAGSTVTKTIWQYSEQLPKDTMEFLKGIAFDCCKVKNYVYQRYSGIKSVGRLTPVYDILNEMRYCGLREQLNLPVVYYELAIADAVTDIKGRWGTVKNKIGELVTANDNLSADDRLYLRTVLKLNSVYAAVLNCRTYEMPKNAAKLDIDVERLNRLLCRLTRKYLTVPQTNNTNSFRISPNGYSYKDGAMRVVCRTPRKRISIPLRDSRTFDRQIQIHIKEDYIALAVPVETKIKKHEDYQNTVYVYVGYRDMLTLSNGNVYGKELGKLLNPETDRIVQKNRERRRLYEAYVQNTEDGNWKKAGNIEANNLGKIKYDRRKEKERLRTTTFINSEINRMLKEEKPAKIVLTKPVTKNRIKLNSKSANRKVTRSFRSYIRERLAYKCLVHSIELIEISSYGTGNRCCTCGTEGKRRGTEFICERCGTQLAAALNSAKNIEIKYCNG